MSLSAGRHPSIGSATIDTLLAARGARRIETPGTPEQATARLAVSRQIWRDYAAFNPLRLHLVADPHTTFRPQGPQQAALLETLQRVRLLKPNGRGGFVARDEDAFQYLAGGWLEELGYCAMLDAGAEEAYYAQRIEWTVGDVTGHNEIDVIARRGRILSFMSCKTAYPVYSDSNTSLRNKIRSYLYETAYWEEHFADGDGRAVLLMSTDFIDEANRNASRAPTLFARAEILDADIIGTDYAGWDRLVQRLRQHWQ